MTKTEQRLHDAANRLISGSGPHIVAVDRCMRDNPMRGAGLKTAMLCNLFVMNPTGDNLEAIRKMVQDSPPAKELERYNAALDALVAMEAFLR